MIFAKIIALPTPQGHNNRKIDFASKMIGDNGKETENILNQISKHKKIFYHEVFPDTNIARKYMDRRIKY